MIYIANETPLENQAGLDQLADLNIHSHKIFKVQCDFKSSKKCRLNYEIEFRRFIKVINTNNGKLPCIYCSRTTKFSGRSNPNTKYFNLNDNFFKNIDTEEKAYLLGWIASDGNVNISGFRISIHQKDIQILQILRNIIDKTLPIKLINNNNMPMCYLQCSSKQISIDICNHLNIKPGKKSNIVNFPSLSQNNFTWSFIRGVFDGDGSISRRTKNTKAPRCSIRSNSKHMLNGIYNFYNHINCCLTPGHSISWDRRGALDFLEKLYDNSNILKLTRKYDLYQYWKYNYTYNSTENRLRGENNSNSKLNWKDINNIRKIFTEGVSLTKISILYNVSQSNITSIIKNKTWIDVNYTSQETTKIKLNEIDIIEIRKMISNKVPNIRIAELFNVNQTHISKIKHNKNWKNIKEQNGK